MQFVCHTRENVMGKEKKKLPECSPLLMYCKKPFCQGH